MTKQSRNNLRHAVEKAYLFMAVSLAFLWATMMPLGISAFVGIRLILRFPGNPIAFFVAVPLCVGPFAFCYLSHFRLLNFLLKFSSRRKQKGDLLDLVKEN